VSDNVIVERPENGCVLNSGRLRQPNENKKVNDNIQTLNKSETSKKISI